MAVIPSRSRMQAHTASPYLASGTPTTATSSTAGWPIEKLLDFARRDVLAAADDHVLHSADDVAIALLVDDREVAGVHPAACIDRLARALGVVPIAAHHAVASGQEFAGDAARRDAPFRVDDLHLHVRMHPAHGTDTPLERSRRAESGS